MPLFPISSFQAAQSGEQNVKIKKDEITVSPDQGGGGGGAGVIVEASSNTTINGYQVPRLTDAQLLTIYNAVVAGKPVTVTDATGTMHFSSLNADSVSGDIYVTMLYFDKMILEYSEGNIDYKELGEGGDTSNCFKYEQGDFIKNSQDDSEQKLLVLNEETNDGSMIDMTTNSIETFVYFIDPDNQEVSSGLSVNQSEVSLNVNEYEDGSHNHSSASINLSVNEGATKKSEIISKTTMFGDDSANVTIEENKAVMPLNEEFMEDDILASYNLVCGTDATDEPNPGFEITGSMMVGDVESGEITKSIVAITAGVNGVLCMSDGTTIIGNLEDTDKQLIIKDGEIQGGGGGGSNKYRHSMYIEFRSTESGYGDCAIIYNYFSNVDHSLWRDYQAGIITNEQLIEMATQFIDNAQKYSANSMWLPPHIGGYVYKDGSRHAPIHSVIRNDDNVYVHAIDDASGAGLISQAWITDVVEGDEYPGE